MLGKPKERDFRVLDALTAPGEVGDDSPDLVALHEQRQKAIQPKSTRSNWGKQPSFDGEITAVLTQFRRK